MFFIIFGLFLIVQAIRFSGKHHDFNPNLFELIPLLLTAALGLMQIYFGAEIISERGIVDTLSLLYATLFLLVFIRTSVK
jgi:hypothetical protein